MPKAYASTIIDAPMEKVWPHLRNFAAGAAFQSSCAKLELRKGAATGDQVGTVREMWLHEAKFHGSHLIERLVALSDLEHTGSYTVQTNDHDEVVSTFKLRPVTDRNATFIEWHTTFEATEPGAGPVMRDFIEKEIFADLFRGLKALVARDGA